MELQSLPYSRLPMVPSTTARLLSPSPRHFVCDHVCNHKNKPASVAGCLYIGLAGLREVLRRLLGQKPYFWVNSDFQGKAVIGMSAVRLTPL